jgi:hypothetical protein
MRLRPIAVAWAMGAVGLQAPFGATGGAVTLEVAGPASPVRVGEVVEVEVLVSGLGEFAAPSLRAFDLDLAFDAGLFDFASVVFDAHLGIPGRIGSPGVQALAAYSESSPGIVDVAETSLLGASALHALQPGAFRLAVVRFEVVAAGTSSIVFDQTILADTGGAALPVEAASGWVLHAVPEPGSAALVGFGLAIGALFRTRSGERGRPRVLQIRGRFQPLVLLACAGPLAPAPAAEACCNAITTALAEYKSASGMVGQAVAVPGDEVAIRVELPCDPTAAAFPPDAAGVEVVLRFEPPGSDSDPGLVTVVPVDSASFRTANCGPARCDTLLFTVPDTDAILPPADDGRGLAGPATILARTGGVPQVEAGPLFLPTYSCDAQDERPDEVFGHFVVLPRANRFADLGVQSQVLATLDARGGLLVPFDYVGAFPASNQRIDFRILRASDPAFPDEPPTPLTVADGEVRAFTEEGRPIPPILKVDADGTSVLGSVDSPRSVVRVQLALDSGAEDRFLQGKGPILLQASFESQASAPLQGLVALGDIVAFTRDEGTDGALNSDGDVVDRVVEVIDATTGSATTTGVAVEEVKGTAGPRRPALVTDGVWVAFLESEARQSIDRTGDGDAADSVLRVYTREGSDRTRFGADGTPLPSELQIAADPLPAIDGAPLAISEGLVFFRSREGDDAPLAVDRVTEEILGGPVTGAHIASDLSPDGRRVLFHSDDSSFVPGDVDSTWDVFLFDRETRAVERLSSAVEGDEGDGGSIWGSMSADGRFVVFHSSEAFNTPGAPGAHYLLDTDADTATLITETTMLGGNPLITRRGDHVALATDLLEGAPVGQVYVWDRIGSSFDLVSKGPDGTPGDGSSFVVGLSEDGRFVALASDATNLLGPGQDTNGVRDVYVSDRETDTLVRASARAGAPEATVRSSALPRAIDAPGEQVVFVSAAPELLPPSLASGPSFQQAYAFDVRRAVLELLSLGIDGEPADGDLITEEISTDGRFVWLTSEASNLTGTPLAASRDLVVLDRSSGVFRALSSSFVDSGSMLRAFASADGRSVASVRQDPVVGPVPPLPDSEVLVFHPGLSASLNGSDGDAADTVLRVFDPASSSLRPTAQVAASAASVAGGRAAVLTPEADEGGQLLNGDLDTGDEVVQVYDGTQVVSLGLAGQQISLSPQTLCFTVREADEDGADRNDDLDSQDAVLATWSTDGLAPPVNAAVAAEDVRAAGTRCVFLTPEADEGPGGTNLNAASGDGDTSDRVLHFLDPLSPEPVNTGQAAEEFVVSGDLVAFRTCEAAQGGVDLNDDNQNGVECVIQVYDMATQTLTNTRRAAIPCDFPGCDPFFEPYAIRGRTVSFVTREADQAGPGVGGDRPPGCLATSPALGCDLNGDGDSLDTVVQIFSVDSGKVQVFEIDDESPPQEVPPFPMELAGGTALVIETSEASAGVDLDGDGVVGDGRGFLFVGDVDEDGTLDASATVPDNCVEAANADQADGDGDGLGEVCDLALPGTPTLPGDVPCDVDRNGRIDASDVAIIFADRGMKAGASDPRDVLPSLDGQVSVLDSAACADLCTYPDCASSPPACGLLGIELAPLWWLARRRRAGGRPQLLTAA